MDASKKLISIVSPCFNEEANVRQCYESTRHVMESMLPEYDYEHIFCDNASTDATAVMLRDIARQDPRVRVILNARNFGPIHSNFNGLVAAQGDAVLVCLPADLQDPPELIPQFVRKWAEGFRVVYGIRKQREEGLLMRSIRKVYYRLVARLSYVHIPVDVGLFQLIDHAVLDALRQGDDFYPFIPGLIAHCGFDKVGIEYTWRRRKRSISKATWAGMFDQAFNALASFSRVPMRACMIAGLLVAALSLGVGCVAWLANLLMNGAMLPSGGAALGFGMTLFSGVQLFFLGVLGEYVTGIHSQVRRRPMVVEKERINFGRRIETPQRRAA